jgi:hypothetical protein
MIRLRYGLAVLAVFALAGCGSHGGNATTSPSADAQDAAVKFAQCMRQHGVNVEDPTPGDPGIRITGKKLDDTKVQAASRDCAKYRPNGQLNPDDPTVRDQMLKMAQCLRAHGVQIADPQPGQGLQLKVKRGDTKAQQAMEACRKLMPPPVSPSPPANGG